MPGSPLVGETSAGNCALIRVVARVDDAGEACDVDRKAGRRAEHCVLDGMLQQVAVAEQSRGCKHGVRAAGGRLHHARDSGAALDVDIGKRGRRLRITREGQVAVVGVDSPQLSPRTDRWRRR